MTDTVNLIPPGALTKPPISENLGTVRSHELGKLDTGLLQLFDGVTFDCFDTLLWRKVDKPTDVFYHLQDQPNFKKLGFTADCRMKCEATARRRQWVKTGSHEVTLHDIYKAFSPELSQKTLQDLADEELNLEMELCFAFSPMLEVLTRALTMKKKVSIVSDTYLTSQQLKKLLSEHLGEALVNQLTHIMVSCEFGVSKSQGLHLHSIKKHKTKNLLHIGDHEYADGKAAMLAGLQSVHFIQYEDGIKELSRLRTNVLSIFDATIRERQPVYTPFKSLLANKNWKNATPSEWLGYAALGPLMVAFATDIHEAVLKLSPPYNPVKVLFLLRDGHLPYQIYQQLYQDQNATAVRISRFASFAASFTDKTSIEHYLADMISGERYEDMLKQLLFNKKECESLLKNINESPNKNQRLIEECTTKSNIQLIVKRSSNYRLRLMRYLENEVKVKRGDTLLLIDLGYSGTTQTKLAPIFKKEFDITLIGHYLISLSTPLWQSNRSGLIDPRVCDDKTMGTLVTYIALLEQLCTTTDQSVIDFNEQGAPIYGDANINGHQHAVLTQIQTAALDFCKDVEATSGLGQFTLNQTSRQQVALGELGRLLFLPTKQETELLKTFKFDLNLGTTDVFEMFDAAKGLQALRTRGLFFMEKNLKTMRTNYPAELRTVNLPLLLTLLTQHRHGLEISQKDMSFCSRAVSVLVLRGGQAINTVLEATPTYDGYYSLSLPIGQGDYTIALVFGEREKWLQILSIDLLPLNRWVSDQESLFTTDIKSTVLTDGMTDHDDGLYHCEATSASLFIKPLEKLMDEPMIIRVIFRPL